MWSDITNGENAGNILTKINSLGILADTFVKSLSNYKISKSSWVTDSTYEDFPYRADIVFVGCTSDLIPYVHYDVPQQISGNLIGALSGEDKVSIWSRIQEEFIIPCVLLFEGG